MSLPSRSFTGLTPSQFEYLDAKHSSAGFVADSSRIGNYTNPAANTADRNWQEVLRADSGYKWTSADQGSWRQNCAFGPHNAPAALDSIVFKK